MITARTLFILAGTTTGAFADTTTPPMRDDDAMPAIDNALEIVLGAGSAVSTGDIGSGMDSDDLVGSTGELELQIGRRITPHLTLGFYGTAHGLSRDVSGASAGIEIDLHGRPRNAIDPWISVGTGVRGLMIENADGRGYIVGAELARLQLGVDFRINKDLAVTPVFGASATLYGAHKQPMQEFEELDGKGVSWMVSAGIAGRFNAFGTRR